jgi:hypothetical protein
MIVTIVSTTCLVASLGAFLWSIAHILRRRKGNQPVEIPRNYRWPSCDYCLDKGDTEFPCYACHAGVMAAGSQCDEYEF